MKRRKEQLQNHTLWMDVHTQQNHKVVDDNCAYSNEKEKDLLKMLYQYFVKNCQLIEEASGEVSALHSVNNGRMDMTIGNATTKSQLFTPANRITYSSVYTSSKNRDSSMSQLNLHKKTSLNSLEKTNQNNSNYNISSPKLILGQFPMLNLILNPKISPSVLES